MPAFHQAQEDADYIEWLKGQREIQNPEALRELVSFHAVAEGLHCVSRLHPTFFEKVTLEGVAKSNTLEMGVPLSGPQFLHL